MKREKKTKPALWTSCFQYEAGAKVRTPNGGTAVILKSIKGTNARGLLRRAYNARVKVWLAEQGNHLCKCCLARRLNFVRAATQCHHKFGRGWRGELIMVESLWIPVCSVCHPAWIHGNPNAARALGMLAPAGEWNRRPA